MRRRVRIAVSVFFGALALLLCVLWGWSYWRLTGIGVWKTFGFRYEMVSADGWLIFLRRQRIYLGFELMLDDPYSFVADSIARQKRGIGLYDDVSNSAIGVAYWLLVLSTGIGAAVPWMRWRFGLRTLLVAMTLVAAVLGLACYAVR